MTAAEDDNLITALQAAVPLHMAEMRDWSEKRRNNEGHFAAQVIAAKGDVLQFGGSKKGQAAHAFNWLARGLAVAAFQPGGVTFAGLHWCVEDDEDCPNGRPTWAGART